MITRAEAERIARDYVAREFAPEEEGQEEFAINDEVTIERPYGWLFVYTTATYLVTRDPDDGVAGAGPLLVLRENGQVIDFPSYHTQESAAEEYERGLAQG
ncbi:YrhB domain-containing protein [Nonomuraea sp. NPDC050783]|uniref:YrhB domain-containing protein n=1 Tax=Nonomuraea sp. NPDC050783 TaxID=3154634 RepID=UPI0034652FE7